MTPDSAAHLSGFQQFAKYSSDTYVLPITQIAFVAFVLFAKVRDGIVRRSRGIVSAVNRGETSRGYFHLAYGLLSVIVLQIVNATDAWKNHKIALSLVDLLLLLYLCYYNGWFRNRVVEWVIRWQQRPD